MKNKNLLIGGAVVVGGLLFFYFRNKRSTDNGEERSIGGGNGSGAGSGSGSGSSTTTGAGAGAGAGSGSGSVPPTTTPTSTSTTAPKGTTTANLTPFEVNKRLLGRCGVRPPSFLKNQVNNYDVCKDSFKAELRGQGLIPFNGLSEDNPSRLDFDGNIVD